MDSKIYKDTLGYIVDHLVENPGEVEIDTVENGDVVTLRLKVAPGDMGKVIGRQGRIAKEIRVLVKAMGLRDNKKVMVDILD